MIRSYRYVRKNVKLSNNDAGIGVFTRINNRNRRYR